MVQKHVDEDDGMKRPVIDSLGRNHKGDGTKHTLIDFLGRNYKREDVAKRDTPTSSLYPYARQIKQLNSYILPMYCIFDLLTMSSDR